MQCWVQLQPFFEMFLNWCDALYPEPDLSNSLCILFSIKLSERMFSWKLIKLVVWQNLMYTFFLILQELFCLYTFCFSLHNMAISRLCMPFCGWGPLLSHNQVNWVSCRWAQMHAIIIIIPAKILAMVECHYNADLLYLLTWFASLCL